EGCDEEKRAQTETDRKQRSRRSCRFGAHPNILDLSSFDPSRVERNESHHEEYREERQHHGQEQGQTTRDAPYEIERRCKQEACGHGGPRASRWKERQDRQEPRVE